MTTKISPSLLGFFPSHSWSFSYCSGERERNFPLTNRLDYIVLVLDTLEKYTRFSRPLLEFLPLCRGTNGCARRPDRMYFPNSNSEIGRRVLRRASNKITFLCILLRCCRARGVRCTCGAARASVGCRCARRSSRCATPLPPREALPLEHSPVQSPQCARCIFDFIS